MQKFHCTAANGRQILGKFYEYGDPIEFDDGQIGLALEHQTAGIVSPGDFNLTSVEQAASGDAGRNSDDDDTSGDGGPVKKTTKTKKGPQ